MTTQHLREAHKTIPFQPFNIRMADGRVFPIAHPEFLYITPPGRVAVVVRVDDSSSTLDLLLMTEIERPFIASASNQ